MKKTLLFVSVLLTLLSFGAYASGQNVTPPSYLLKVMPGQVQDLVEVLVIQHTGFVQGLDQLFHLAGA